MVLSANGAVPTLSQVAGRLFLSTRTLRRRLEDAQTSYQEIVGETRRDLAVGYLTHTIPEYRSDRRDPRIQRHRKFPTGIQALDGRVAAAVSPPGPLGWTGRSALGSGNPHSARRMAVSRYAQRSAVTPNDDGPWMLSTC